jgi:hypothetical protein
MALGGRGAEAGVVPAGLSVSAGGGAVGFAQEGNRGLVKTGGSWNGRVSLGTFSLVGVEGTYVGSSQGYQSGSGTLVGNQIAGDIRFNLGAYRVQPFVFGGVGYEWMRSYNTVSATAYNPGDQTIVPFGGGIAAYVGHLHEWTVDARGTYNIGTRANIIGAVRPDQWFATGNLGYVF